jgi:acid stress chaperone HdeB
LRRRVFDRRAAVPFGAIGFDPKRGNSYHRAHPAPPRATKRENPMRLLAALFAAAMLMVGPARAQVVDLSTIKCKEFVESSKENIGVIAMWLHGYYAGKADAPAIIDFDKFTKDAEKLGKYCGNNPTHGLITAADKTLAED